jgi:hypothetical protein
LGKDDSTSYTDRFQRAFLQSGNLHIRHAEFLAGAMANMVVIAGCVMWLVHGRWALHDGFGYRFFYEGISPSDLLDAYGAPGTAERMGSLTLDVALLFMASERLYGIAGLVHAAGLCLRQRRRALEYVAEHRPPSESAEGRSPEVEGALKHVDECALSAEFALELSAIRWLVLREPLMVAFLCTLKLFGAALGFLALPYLASHLPLGQWAADGAEALDPTVPLCLGLCLALPLFHTLWEAARANQKLCDERTFILEEAESVLATLPPGSESADADFVRLRNKANEVLRTSMLCWPGGRELGYCEPLLLVSFAIGIAFLAVLRSGLADAFI